MSLCSSCLCGAVANRQENEFYCMVKGGSREHGESRTNYLNRSKVKTKSECEHYIPRQGNRP